MLFLSQLKDVFEFYFNATQYSITNQFIHDALKYSVHSLSFFPTFPHRSNTFRHTFHTIETFARALRLTHSQHLTDAFQPPTNHFGRSKFKK